MVSIDDLKELTLYKKQFFLPIDPKNKKLNSAIMLLTPNRQSSIIAMSEPYTINRKYFESYYLEKNITRFIKNESLVNIEDPGEYLFEAKLSTEERNDLADSEFGLPKKRKYPLNDKKHILLAIKFFNYCDNEDRDELARNILKAIGEKLSDEEIADIHVGKDNDFLPYWEKSKYYKTDKVSEAFSTDIEYKLNLGEKRGLRNLINTTAIGSLKSKASKECEIVFSGYANDIEQVKRYFNKKYIPRSFLVMNKKKIPPKVNIIVSSDPSTTEEFTDDSMLVYTPSAISQILPRVTYENYLLYTIQLYAVYTLKPAHGLYYTHPGRVMDTLAEPAAVVLSGILDKDILKDKDDDALGVERVFNYIIETEGMNKFIEIIASNDTRAIYKYAKDFGIEKTYKRIREDVELIYEEEEVSNNSSEKKATIPSIENPMPESLKDIQQIGTKLKRRLRQHTIYKLNKIVRDISRGNVGTDSRGATTFQQVQAGDVGTTMQDLVKEDCIFEGNYVYLFEDNKTYNTTIKKALYQDRIKNNKQILQIYSQMKLDLPFIKYAYTDIARYKNRNLFIDLSYYNESFFKNISALNSEEKDNNIRLFRTYIELMERLLKDDKFTSYTKKTIFIPILDWQHNNSTKMWMYKEDINPISVIYYMMKNDPNALKRVFGDKDIIFLGGRNYFKVNFSTTDFTNGLAASKFLTLTRRIISLGYNSADPDPEGELEDSPSGIAMDLIDKVEKSQNVTINNVSKIATLKKSIDLVQTSSPIVAKPSVVVATKVSSTSKTKKKSTKETSKQEPKENNTTEETNNQPSTSVLPSTANADNATSEEDKKDAIVDAIAQAANDSNSTDDAMKKLDNEQFKEMIIALQNNSEENIRIDKAQASKVVNAQNEFHKKQVAGKSVEELLSENKAATELPKTDLNVASINEDWKELTFVNFDKDYDLNSDIVKMLDSMQHWTFPIAVKNIDIKDNSTSEDIVDLWTIECLDFKGTRFTLKVDIPKFINGSNFLKLRGNEKALMIQSALLPLIKTGLDECQIIGSGGYNKIFVRKFGARAGQSVPAASNLLRALNKYIKDHDDIKVVMGDNTKICAKYELPIDYIDLSQVINSIETKTTKIYFNQDEIRSEYEVDDTKGIPIGVQKIYSKEEKKNVETILYFDGTLYNTIARAIASVLCADNPEFAKIYYSIIVSNSTCTYSKASILDKKIPVVLICAYLEGLITTMNKAGINYRFEQELSKEIRHSDNYDYLKFSDGYLIYEVTYSSSLLMNGFKEHDTESYSLNDINNRMMYIDFFNVYGNFIEDGLENSYDCMIDPITKEILEKIKLPSDYTSVLIYASNLLADNKYVKHIDQAGRRWRRKELIAGYFYKALSSAYQDYSRSLRNSRKGTKMTIKQSEIIDLILSKDPAMSDLSVNNAINDVECANTVTNKGLVGMNVSRGYTINTRGYDDSMLNLLGMDTGFSGTVGINRQATVNANIEGARGFVKTIDGDTDKLSTAAAFTITEAVTPFGSTHDDPPRTLMTFVQTSKHMVRCDNNDPTLVTTGADEALPFLTSDIFAYKAKKDGKVVELVQEGFGKKNYMVVEYKDGTHDYINLSEEVKKNSDGGYFVPMKLDTDLTLDKTFKAGEVIAYDRSSFSKSLGESGNLAANVGTLAKVAIINTDEGFEDSAAVTESFASKIGTFVIQGIETRVDKGSNVFIYKNIGDNVMEGDTLFAYQADFDDEVANTLLKNLTTDTDQISELGRTPVKSKYTGIVSDIVIYRTCDLEEMSESLQKFVTKYDSKITGTKSVYKKYGIDSSLLQKTDKVPEMGKTKNLDEAILIIYYIKYNDRLSIGDKIVFYSANKGVIKYIIPKEDEPYTDFRPNEHVDSFMSLSSISGRMTCSIPLFAATSKLMVELDRSIKDLAGIPYDESKL